VIQQKIQNPYEEQDENKILKPKTEQGEYAEKYTQCTLDTSVVKKIKDQRKSECKRTDK
jgi:hypothetical protein